MKQDTEVAGYVVFRRGTKNGLIYEIYEITYNDTVRLITLTENEAGNVLTALARQEPPQDPSLDELKEKMYSRGTQQFNDIYDFLQTLGKM